MNQAGFTMIELLVVISVIGVLSVAVLSSINPIEQINKGRDTRTRSDAAQLINAIDRYFSIHEEYPWNTNTDTYTAGASYDKYNEAFTFYENDTGKVNTTGLTASVDAWDWVDILSTVAEVKSGFIQRLKTDANVDYVLTKAATANATMYVCFPPSSNAFDQEASKRCGDGRTTGFEADYPDDTACPSGCETATTDANYCLICLP